MFAEGKSLTSEKCIRIDNKARRNSEQEARKNSSTRCVSKYATLKWKEMEVKVKLALQL